MISSEIEFTILQLKDGRKLIVKSDNIVRRIQRFVETIKGIYSVKDDSEETNTTVMNKLKRTQLECPICPPNKGENSKRKSKHGKAKPKYKNKRSKP